MIAAFSVRMAKVSRLTVLPKIFCSLERHKKAHFAEGTWLALPKSALLGVA